MAVSISGAVDPILPGQAEEPFSLMGASPATSNVPDVIGGKDFAPQAQAPAQKVGGFKTTDAIGAGFAGVGASQGVTPTTSAPEAITGALLSGVTGAASGALVAGVPGAIVGGVIGLAAGGVKAFFGLKSARKSERDRARLVEKAEKQRKQEIARDEKWRRINRLDNLNVAGENRKQVKLQNSWAQFQNVQNNMFNMANREDAAGQNIRNQLRGAA